MFTVIKQLRSHNQIENRYLMHSMFMDKHYISVTSAKFNKGDTMTTISPVAQGSKKYLLKTYN